MYHLRGIQPGGQVFGNYEDAAEAAQIGGGGAEGVTEFGGGIGIVGQGNDEIAGKF